MAEFGSNRSIASQAFVNLTDQAGNPLVSTDSSFGSSPLGIAPLTQSFFGLPNATFNLTPPDTSAVISGANLVPYWDLENSSSEVMAATSVYDSTTETYGIKLNPGTATTGDYLIFKSRSYLVNDDNIGLRQKAFATITKNGTYSSSTQWNLTMSATYYSATDTALHTAVIGTALDNATWTTINGFTTTGGTAINAAARYVDIALTLTVTAPVTSATSVTVKSVLLATSTAASSSFLVTETFTTSQTWTRPTGVTSLVAVVAYSGGGGGDGGSAYYTINGYSGSESLGGNPGAYAIIRDLYIGTAASVSVGVGAGGAGGLGGTAAKTGTAVPTPTLRTAGATGGASTFGSFLSVATGINDNGIVPGTVVARTPFIDTFVTPLAATIGTATRFDRSFFEANGYLDLPYQTYVTSSGGNGGNGTATGATLGGSVSTGGVLTLGGTAGQGTYFAGRGSTGAPGRIDNSGAYAYVGSSLPTAAGTRFAGSAQGGAGGGGGSGAWKQTVAGTAAVTGGNGGSASANSASGGGGGGEAVFGGVALGTAVYFPTRGTAIGGNGGNGGAGVVIIAYIA
jgi:hypothetical protein